MTNHNGLAVLKYSIFFSFDVDIVQLSFCLLLFGLVFNLQQQQQQLRRQLQRRSKWYLNDLNTCKFLVLRSYFHFQL